MKELFGIIRHLLGYVGGVLSARGMVSEEVAESAAAAAAPGSSDVELVSGVIMLAATVAWSLYQKRTGRL